MKLKLRNTSQLGKAFALVELLVGVAVLGIMFVALYSGFSAGFAVVQLARENLRATQILQEKVETIRLYTWEQLNTSGFVPLTFTEPFYAGKSAAESGILYTGKVTMAQAPISETYKTDLKLISMEVSWYSAGVQRKRDMQTFVSHYGLQNYIY
jgi:type II secretory pathway pseudopilin PulG